MPASGQITSPTVIDGIEDTQEQDLPNNEQIISDLEREIQLLELRLEQFRNDGKEANYGDSSRPSLEMVTEQIHDLEQLVKENEILSGLTIAEASYTILKQDDTSSVRQHNVVGEAGGMQFKLQYDVCENFQKADSDDRRAEIQTLEVDVRDDMVALLRPHLVGIATDVSVRELFQLMSSYGRWVEDRERAINHFASTFPELVQRVDANDEACNFSMLISDAKKELNFHILWGLKVLPMRSVVPDLQLQVTASPEALSRDKKGVLQAAPEMFQLMMKKFGIESAIHMLVKLLDDPPP